MAYVSGGVDDIATKKELRDRVRQNPRSVRFYCTNLVGTTWEGLVSDLPPGMILSISGPDPHRDRRWFATVKRGRDGFEVR